MNLLEILGKIGFDWQVALANLVNFLIIFWLLKKYVFSKLSKAISERKQKIEEGVQNAKSAASSLEEANRQKEEVIKEARAEARRIVEEARAEKQAIVESTKQEAAEEAGLIKEKASKKLEQEEEKMERRLREEAREVVIAGVEKILGEKMEEKEAKRFQESLIKSQ